MSDPNNFDSRGRFLPNNSVSRLGGRPKGSRTKLGTKWCDDVYADWLEERGDPRGEILGEVPDLCPFSHRASTGVESLDARQQPNHG